LTPVVIHGKNNFAGGSDLAQKLLDQHPEVTAIFVASDTMAFGVMRALIDAGRKISWFAFITWRFVSS